MGITGLKLCLADGISGCLFLKNLLIGRLKRFQEFLWTEEFLRSKRPFVELFLEKLRQICLLWFVCRSLIFFLKQEQTGFLIKSYFFQFFLVFSIAFLQQVRLVLLHQNSHHPEQAELLLTTEKPFQQ